MLVALAQRGMQARVVGTAGELTVAPEPEVTSRSSNPMLAYVGRMMTRCLWFLMVLPL